MSTTMRTETIHGAAQEFEPLDKNVTPKAAGQTTGEISQQKVLGAYQTVSLQGLGPVTFGGHPPSSGQATTGPVGQIRPDGVTGAIGRAGARCFGGAMAGSNNTWWGAVVGCVTGAGDSLLSDAATAIFDGGNEQEDPMPPIDVTPSPDPSPMPYTSNAPDDAPPTPSGPSCDGSEDGPESGAVGGGGSDGGLLDNLLHEQD